MATATKVLFKSNAILKSINSPLLVATNEQQMEIEYHLSYHYHFYHGHHCNVQYN